VKRDPEVDELRSMRLMQLVRASRATFAARAKYQRLRLQELDIVRSLAVDDSEEADTLLKDAEWQAGEVKHTLQRDGYGLINRACCLFPERDVESEDDNASEWSAHDRLHQAGSPIPSPDTVSRCSHPSH
jgi:hypothetical protein